MNVLNAEQFALLNGLEIEEVSEFFKGLVREERTD